MEASPARGVEVDRRRVDADGPEQPGAPYAWLEIVPLMGRVADGARIEEVYSDEPEGSVAHAPVGTDVQTVHEAHVGVEVPR